MNIAPLTWTGVVLSVGALLGLVWLRHALSGGGVGWFLVRGFFLFVIVVWCVTFVCNTAVYLLAKRTG